ncbi:tudor domain-containing 6 [Halichoeres trimaculatus]|uniref:tudor domain-containing 6 n=1 Tax=Halichoeres trimaculatus TaxID=147232 RepID=UPI003D9F7017
MTSIEGLPARGSDITLFISKVHLHPLCVLVEFWGKFNKEKTGDYECLAKEIQSPGETFQEFEGNSGDQCLVQIDGTWYRSRIVSRHGPKYSVFLIDKGISFNTTFSKLAWGKRKHFCLQPEVEFCVLANVLPVSTENRWSPVALEFLKSISGKSVKAHVQDVLLPQRAFLLDIPCIAKQMYEMGIAKRLSPDTFHDFVLKSLQSPSGAGESAGIGLSSGGEGESLNNKELFLYPELQAGTVETVTVTDVTNPQRIFCQLKVFSQELKKLSEQITLCCEGRMTKCLVGPAMIGCPCAARGNDGKWYRSVLQQVLSNNQVEVLNIDCGTKHLVQAENVRPLAAEFFRMPVVTYICSLHGIVDKGVGWTASQIGYLKTLLLNKTVIAKFEYQSVSEGVYYVTLYGDENTNINNLFASNMSCSLESKKVPGDYAPCNVTCRRQDPPQRDGSHRKMSEKQEGKGTMERFPAEDLSLNSSHVAVVQHVSDPSEFWIQTQNYENELVELMDRIYDLYKDSENTDVRNPTVGLYCASKSEDGDFYRATVTEVGEAEIKVLFVDYGNTENVDRCNIRALPDKFKKLPRLALKCKLAGIRPNGQKWSQSACEFFIKATKEKALNVHVTAKYDDYYVVQLTDPEAQGERDLAALMCCSGFAERTETQRQPKVTPTAQLPDARLSGTNVYQGTSCETLNTVKVFGNQRTPTFKEHMFPTGSILDVSVSFIESPNDFWCQLVQNAELLKLLMHDMQTYYQGSEFQPLVETACVARHPDNKMWYRALVIQKHETPHVDVLFVDYGQTETVSISDLRRICPQFLTLHGQAFRCSLLNPLGPMSAANEWSEEAVTRFHNFVENAASGFVLLKCTIYAVMFSEQKIVFNIVDLETPFESVSASMVSLLKSAPPKKAAGSSFRLDTYYYSTHNIKTGKEEQVTVTCVNSVSQFYCQLGRNADVINDLEIKVNSLCHQLENVKLPTVFGALCFAKYTDGRWYRGQIKATKPAILVHFVDYGDTIEVEKSALLPVPREANDIMSVPVQALVCSLSDVPADAPDEVNSWFETSVTDCKFRALVVAREPDGKLQVELYHGNTQINAKIKEKFQIGMHSEKVVVHQSWKAPDLPLNHRQKSLKAASKQIEGMDSETIKNSLSASKPAHKLRDADKNLHSKSKLTRSGENGQKVKAFPLKLYQPPHQRKNLEKAQNDEGKDSTAQTKPREMQHPTAQLVTSTQLVKDSNRESNCEALPKLADLPSKSITPGMTAEVYVSQCNSPLSFYLQLVREEEEIISLVEKLNDEVIPQTNSIKDVYPGDLVQAEFPEDSSWYRAVVREIHSNATALVEFIDFGNTAVLPVSRLGRLQKCFLELPTFSTHCMLSNPATVEEEKVLDPEAVSAFKEDIGETGEKVFKCSFIRESGSVWEVSLEDSGVNLTCKTPSQFPTDGSEINSGKHEQMELKPAQNSDRRQVPDNSQLSSCSLRYPQQEFSEGQKLDAYITTTNNDQTFWCQPADSGELDKITLGVAEVGDAVDKDFNFASFPPGSPCIALFPNDNLWYRAEVINKEGNELLVSFVDYGNQSKVSVSGVRKIPKDLAKIPPQAFLCKLEGLDASNGSWDSGAVDELSVLTVDKAVQMTVTRVSREEGKTTCFVLVQCEGQMINEVLKTWWRPSMAENKLQCDPTVEEIPPPKNLLEPQNQMDTSVACVCPPGDHGGEQSAKEHICAQTVEVTSEEDGSMTSEPQILRKTESLGETLSREGVNMTPRKTVSETKEKDLLTHVEDTEEPKETEEEAASVMETFESDDINVLLLERPGEDTNESGSMAISLQPGEIGTYSVERSSDETLSPEVNTCTEEVGSMIDTVVPDDISSVLDKNLTEASDELGITETLLESLPEEVHTHSMESSFDTMTVSAPKEEKQDTDVTEPVVLTRTTAVKMVPRESIWPAESINLTSNSFEQTGTDLLLSSCVHPASEAPTEQDSEPEGGVLKEELLCVTKDDENDVMAEGKPVAHHQETDPGPPADSGTAASELHLCTASSHDVDSPESEPSCCGEEAGLTEIRPGHPEPDHRQVPSASADGVSAVRAKEMVQNETLLSCTEFPCDQPAEALTEQESEPEGGVLKEELLCVTKDDEIVVMAEGKQVAHHQETDPDSPTEHGIQTKDLSLYDEAFSIEDTSLSEDKTLTPTEKLSDSEPQVSTTPSPDLDHLVEEVTCLVGEICLEDVGRDLQTAAETEGCEQLVHTHPEHKEDSSKGELGQEMSSLEDSFEGQLSEVTHLSLKASDDSEGHLTGRIPAEE